MASLACTVYPSSRGSSIASSAPGAPRDGGPYPHLIEGLTRLELDSAMTSSIKCSGSLPGGGLSLDDPTALVGGGFEGVTLSIDALTPPVLMKSIPMTSSLSVTFT